MNIHVGDEIELTEQVVPENTAKEWGSGSLPVYATPAMILLIEKAAVKLLDGKLEEGQTSVGTNLNIAHVSRSEEHTLNSSHNVISRMPSSA